MYGLTLNLLPYIHRFSSSLNSEISRSSAWQYRAKAFYGLLPIRYLVDTGVVDRRPPAHASENRSVTQYPPDVLPGGSLDRIF